MHTLVGDAARRVLIFVPVMSFLAPPPGETKRALFSQVLSNCDIVECILASFGANAPNAGRVSRLWLDAAQRVLARCHVVELEASAGEYWTLDDEDDLDEDDLEGDTPAQHHGLQVCSNASWMVATPTGLLVSDCNNGRIVVLDPTGQPVRNIEPFCLPNGITLWSHPVPTQAER